MMKVLSKSRQVELFFRDNIASGNWKPGMQLPSERELCDQLGVGVITVKSVMARLAGEGLIVRRQKLGSFVAENVSKANIAFFVDPAALISPESYFYSHFFVGLREHIAAAGYHAIVISEYGNNFDVLRALLQGTVGAIVMNENPELLAFFDRIGVQRVCVVAGNHRAPGSVVLDYGALGRMAGEVMREYGYDNFAVMTQHDPRQLLPGGEHRAIVQALADGDESRIINVPWAADCRYAYEEFKRWWRSARRRDAIFFYDDGIFDVASRAMLELGIRVPEQLNILTQTNQGRYFHFPVPLARLEFDPAALAAASWRQLRLLIDTRQPLPTSVALSPSFRAGESLRRRVV